MTARLRIDYPKTPAGKRQWAQEYGLNAIYAGKHWARRKANADYWHTLTKAAMLRAGIRKAPAATAVAITFLWNDCLDLDNHSYMGKMIVDAMRGHLLCDDTRRYGCDRGALMAMRKSCVGCRYHKAFIRFGGKGLPLPDRYGQG